MAKKVGQNGRGTSSSRRRAAEWDREHAYQGRDLWRPTQLTGEGHQILPTSSEPLFAKGSSIRRTAKWLVGACDNDGRPRGMRVINRPFMTLISEQRVAALNKKTPSNRDAENAANFLTRPPLFWTAERVIHHAIGNGSVLLTLTADAATTENSMDEAAEIEELFGFPASCIKTVVVSSIGSNDKDTIHKTTTDLEKLIASQTPEQPLLLYGSPTPFLRSPSA